MKKIVFLFIIFFAINCGYAQQVVVRAVVDSSEVLIGQPVKIHVQLSQPKSFKIDWSETDSLGLLEILGRSPVDTVKTTDPEILLRSQTYTVSAYDSGAFTVDPFVFQYKVPGNDKMQYAYSDSLQLFFKTIPVDMEKDIRDIAPIAEVPFDWRIILFIILGVLLFILLAGGIILFIINKRKTNTEPEEVIQFTRPAHEIALEELKLLDESKQWQQGKIKYYYTAITDILRQYIYQRWNVNAMELTSDEILQHGFINLVTHDSREKLAYILRLADMVKFAKVIPGASDHEQSMRNALAFVQATIPVVHVEKEKSEKEVSA